MHYKKYYVVVHDEALLKYQTRLPGMLNKILHVCTELLHFIGDIHFVVVAKDKLKKGAVLKPQQKQKMVLLSYEVPC